MGFLMGCGICCMSLSVWGAIQLLFMGLFYRLESFTLIEDAEAHEYDDTVDFIKKTTKFYEQLSLNCWIAAGLYVVTMALCALCIFKARKTAREQRAILESDILSCAPKVDKKKQVKPKKGKK